MKVEGRVEGVESKFANFGERRGRPQCSDEQHRKSKHRERLSSELKRPQRRRRVRDDVGAARSALARLGPMGMPTRPEVGPRRGKGAAGADRGAAR